jgi:hypothetical protein
MGAAPTPARICPECGTSNSGLSLFCSECGASLTNAALEGAGDNQTTTTFRPVTDDRTLSDPYATQQFEPQVRSQSTATGITPSGPAWTAPVSGSTTGYRREENRRGLVLGWIAGVLILVVIGYLGWTSFLDPDTRDSIIGIFS